MSDSIFRQESDFLGTRSIPASTYWGVHTGRDLDNFAITELMTLAETQALLVPARLTKPPDVGVPDLAR